jgi:tetratricopeptide (TPR) repeat protein
MRRLGLFLLLAACAHAPRSNDPQNWLELRSEHFLVRTDLPEEDARKAVTDMELVRTALLGAGWHSNREPKARTPVVLLSTEAELHEFAQKSIVGFASQSIYGEPFLTISMAQDVLEQELFKHELTHVINNGFLVSKPRWVNEGIACYLEMLEIKRGGSAAVMGKPSLERLAYLNRRPVQNWFAQINTGDQIQQTTGEQGYAFETASWALVHYFVDVKPAAFDKYLNSLAHGEESWRAFSDAFPGLREPELAEAMRAYLKSGRLRIDTLPIKPWSGEIAVARMPPAEVFALRGDLLRLSPGFASRKELMQIEVQKSLAIDPGNPYALMLQEGSNAAAATAAHPDDWRSWFLAAERNENRKERAAIDQAARLAPDNPSVLEHLTFADLYSGAYDRALANATRAVELAPGRTDALDALAQAYAANSRCDDAAVAEQRAIDAIPDAAANGVPASLLRRQRELRDSCASAQAQPQIQSVQRVSAEVKLKSCKKPMPRVTSKLDLQIDFTLAEDGSTKGVKVSGVATEAMRAAMQKYVESCSYEPVVVDGKPQAVQTTTRFKTGK